MEFVFCNILCNLTLGMENLVPIAIYLVIWPFKNDYRSSVDKASKDHGEDRRYSCLGLG
jgi:hypothetical protein